MSSQHSDNRYYREEFEPRRRSWRALLIVVLVISATVTHYVAFLGGAYLKGQECRSVMRAVSATRPVCPSPVANNSPLTQWKCTANEFKEYRGACKQRAISEIRIPPKE